MKKINFEINEDRKKLKITYGEQSLELLFTEETNSNLDDVFDFIIDNIDEVRIENTFPKESDETYVKVATAIFEAISQELEEIKKHRLHFLEEETSI